MLARAKSAATALLQKASSKARSCLHAGHAAHSSAPLQSHFLDMFHCFTDQGDPCIRHHGSVAASTYPAHVPKALLIIKSYSL